MIQPTEDEDVRKHAMFFSHWYPLNGSQEYLAAGVGEERPGRQFLDSGAVGKRVAVGEVVPQFQENTDGSVSMMQPDWWISINIQKANVRD